MTSSVSMKLMMLFKDQVEAFNVDHEITKTTLSANFD